VVIRNSTLRSVLDDSAFGNLSSRTFQAVDGYFTPLIEFIYSSTLWSRIGGIDTIGSPVDYVYFLETRLNQLGTISSFSMTDYENHELVIELSGNEDKNWYVTSSGSGKSLTSMRENNGIRYLSLADGDTIHSVELKEEIPIRISSPYLLPYLDLPGISLHLDSTKDNNRNGLNLTFDLPLKQMALRLKHEGALKDAVIFLLMPSQKDFIFLPVGDILALNVKALEGSVPEEINELNDGAGLLTDSLLSAGESPDDGEIHFRFTYKGKTWFTEFRHLNMGSETISLGTLIPETSLWTVQASFPLQIFLIILLFSTSFLIFRLVQDYKHVYRTAIKPEEIIREIINRGETHKMEFKSSLRWDYRDGKLNKTLEEVIIKSVAAFNNSDGGTILIGVSDDGEILGLNMDYSVLRDSGKDFYELHIRNLLASRYGLGYTTKNLKIDFPVIEGLEICQILIRRGKEPLYTKISRKGGGPVEKFYIRSGNASCVLENISEVSEYIITRFRHYTIRK